METPVSYTHLDVYKRQRKKYMDNPPEGMTSKDIRNMSEDELLDMDFFLNENDLFADEAGVTALAGHRAAILFNRNL